MGNQERLRDLLQVTEIVSPKTGRRIGPASQIGAYFGISRAPSGKRHLGIICCWRTVRVKIYLEETGNTKGTSGLGAGMNRPDQMVGPSKCRGIALSLIALLQSTGLKTLGETLVDCIMLKGIHIFRNIRTAASTISQ